VTMVSFGIGDAIAITETCIKLASSIRDCNKAPAEYEVSLNTLVSFHETFQALSKEFTRGHYVESNVLRLQRHHTEDRIRIELGRMNTALRQCYRILDERYVRLSSPQAPLLVEEN